MQAGCHEAEALINSRRVFHIVPSLSFFWEVGAVGTRMCGRNGDRNGDRKEQMRKRKLKRARVAQENMDGKSDRKRGKSLGKSLSSPVAQEKRHCGATTAKGLWTTALG
ncbi:uncharacterized protein SPSK_05711 [Sporothrix schenckii 1099-18]|uniref:Uncharacterized protein n=1 Tax=Sporothrix schenckii 1099-18 TaxID=1397361 RepID=A0A0F2LVW4_SPOSC|nr:uncharacterized protein SPSK_05711 [Sporothrix schenckii 1099-18]KJR80969.1 hypothetical protein SPSK_05711 [Sporothrix schenckii 1099-18]